MSPTHLHLLLNHVPVLGTAFGLGLLVFGMGRKSQELKKTALGVFVIVALLAVPAYLTGEPAEDGVQGLPGIVGSVTVSGLPQRDDHNLVVEALCALLGKDFAALRLGPESA